MSMTEKSTKSFLTELRSSAATPGGGGASALAASLGVSLGVMVGSLTVGKKKYADVEEDIKSLIARGTELGESLAECVDKDAAAFGPLAEAYGIPEDAPGRDETLESCLRDAAAVPYEIMELTCEAIEVLESFAAKGSRMVISDAATGASIARGALAGAAVNVMVNTRLMKDASYASEMNAGVERMTDEYIKRADAVYYSLLDGFKKCPED